jgi:hypothetical protein
MTLVTVRLHALSLQFHLSIFCEIHPIVVHNMSVMTMYYRQPQHILLVPSVDATCFGRVEHPQALKYMMLKNTSKSAWLHFKNLRSHKLLKLLQSLYSSKM